MSEGPGTGNRLFGEPAKVQVHLLALRQKQLNPTISSVNESVTTQSLESPALAGAGDPKSRLPFPGLSALGRLLGSPQDVSDSTKRWAGRKGFLQRVCGCQASLGEPSGGQAGRGPREGGVGVLKQVCFPLG